MVAKTSQNTTLSTDERLQKLKEAICRLEEIEQGAHADEIFIRETAYVLALAEAVLPGLALARASKSSYLAKVHKQVWSRKNHG